MFHSVVARNIFGQSLVPMHANVLTPNTRGHINRKFRGGEASKNSPSARACYREHVRGKTQLHAATSTSALFQTFAKNPGRLDFVQESLVVCQPAPLDRVERI